MIAVLQRTILVGVSVLFLSLLRCDCATVKNVILQKVLCCQLAVTLKDSDMGLFASFEQNNLNWSAYYQATLSRNLTHVAKIFTKGKCARSRRIGAHNGVK